MGEHVGSYSCTTRGRRGGTLATSTFAPHRAFCSLREKKQAHHVHRMAHRVLVLHRYFTHFWQISSVAGTWWPQGLAYNNGGLHSTS